MLLHCLPLHNFRDVGNSLLNAWAARNVGVTLKNKERSDLSVGWHRVLCGIIMCERHCVSETIDFWLSLIQNLEKLWFYFKWEMGIQHVASVGCLGMECKASKHWRENKLCMYVFTHQGRLAGVSESICSQCNECPPHTPSLTCSRH